MSHALDYANYWRRPNGRLQTVLVLFFRHRRFVRRLLGGMWEEWEWDSGYREWFWSHRFSHPEMRCAGIYLRHRESFDLRRWRPYRNWKQFATERFLLKAALSAAQGKYLKSRWYELWADHFDYPGELMTPEAREEQGFPREDLGPETSLTPD